MSLNCGIAGLPNVGKSTIFSALTSAPAEAANYPFCTIDPNVGIVKVPDRRLRKIASIFNPKETIPAVTEFVDIAGLVKGASKGEGLGNQFLGHIRAVDAIIHVVRCFENDDIIHVHGSVDPLRDIEIINTELALADLQTVEKKLQGIDRQIRNTDKRISEPAKIAKPVLERLQETLNEGKAGRSLELNDDENESIRDLQLLTMKPVLYACNVDEDSLTGENDAVRKVQEHATSEGSETVVLCGHIESEIASLESEEERLEFLNELGLEKSGLERLIHAAYHLMGLRTYFTAGEKEVRAWTFHEGMSAPETAGIIHSDFQKGFIRAEVYHYDDLLEYGTEQKVKEQGKLRVEGKEYIVKDGDILHFRFNV